MNIIASPACFLRKFKKLSIQNIMSFLEYFPMLQGYSKILEYVKVDSKKLKTDFRN